MERDEIKREVMRPQQQTVSENDEMQHIKHIVVPSPSNSIDATISEGWSREAILKRLWSKPTFQDEVTGFALKNPAAPEETDLKVNIRPPGLGEVFRAYPTMLTSTVIEHDGRHYLADPEFSNSLSPAMDMNTK